MGPNSNGSALSHSYKHRGQVWLDGRTVGRSGGTTSVETHTTASTDPHRTDRIISNAYMRCVLMTSYDAGLWTPALNMVPEIYLLIKIQFIANGNTEVVQLTLQ
uniref:SFRICE_032936 n=1 Tax=Spodoptera frugiperda TaxID=7108 RepID=A0A2H1VKC7_SPOFR